MSEVSVEEPSIDYDGNAHCHKDDKTIERINVNGEQRGGDQAQNNESEHDPCAPPIEFET